MTARRDLLDLSASVGALGGTITRGHFEDGQELFIHIPGQRAASFTEYWGDEETAEQKALQWVIDYAYANRTVSPLRDQLPDCGHSSLESLMQEGADHE